MKMTAEDAVRLAKLFYTDHQGEIDQYLPGNIGMGETGSLGGILQTANDLHLGHSLVYEASVKLHNLGEFFEAMGVAMKEQHWGIAGKTLDPNDPDAPGKR